MLNIAICEDDKKDCDTLLSCIRSACDMLKLKARTTVFSCAEDFLGAHEQNPFSIVFMDIYLNGSSGIHAVQDASAGKQCQFIFTTVSKEHAIEAFSLNAAHYLVKPLTCALVSEALERCLSRLKEESSRILEIKTTQGVVPIPIPMDSIIFVEVFNNICVIHTKNNSFQTYMSLSALFKLLDPAYFLRVQRSFAVNMHFIESFFYDHIILQNGKEIVISRNRRAELKKQYQQFLFRFARGG